MLRIVIVSLKILITHTGYASGGSHAHMQAVLPASASAANAKTSHLIKSNSETDAGHLERALKEQLQFGECKSEDKKV